MYNVSYPYAMNSSEAQKMMSDMMAAAFRDMPKPEVPGWLEALGNFITLHPVVALLVVVVAAALISLVIRELVCFYFKTNDILRRLKRLEEKIK
jgi:hypothetical protein